MLFQHSVSLPPQETLQGSPWSIITGTVVAIASGVIDDIISDDVSNDGDNEDPPDTVNCSIDSPKLVTGVLVSAPIPV